MVFKDSGELTNWPSEVFIVGSNILRYTKCPEHI